MTLKNDIETLDSKNEDNLNFANSFFFQPKKLFLLKSNTVEISYIKDFKSEITLDYQKITEQLSIPTKTTKKSPLKIASKIRKDEYLTQVQKILEHIHRGDIYEVNFCQEFFSKGTSIKPLEVYHHLNQISKAPFASFIKLNAHYILSASPERFLSKKENTIISQPIKGTAARYDNQDKDQEMINLLKNDPKERSENVMIVDLVRNDLSKHAVQGSVKVEELCNIYTFKQVHQMISTVQAEVVPHTSITEILKATFPMGSMTGAPKVSAMQLIERYEKTKRGVYSGSIGYITPNKDFDFNVVIRTILYNEIEKYISYSVGSAITAKSNPHKEYAECILKAKAMREVLES